MSHQKAAYPDSEVIGMKGKWLWLGAVLLMIVFTVWELVQLFRSEEVAVFYPVKTTETVLVIDAGHGGADGGAVSPSGTVESAVNLDIALKLNQLAGLFGVQTVLTREGDYSIHDSSAATLREQKRSDLENRVALVNGTENAVLISIHQNIYESSSSRGTQVFYASETCRDWAVQTQALFATQVDASNTRQAAVISDTVYLMSHITCPALLVECGFLSNPEEEALLLTPEYQRKLAAVLLAGYIQEFV